jgi:tRNA pseudouridine38-40 synthase
MPRFKLTIEYDGTRYSGWQKHPGVRTVQGEMEAAIRETAGTPKIEFQGSGRTDAGVHALGQVAHLEVATVLEPHIFRRKINDALPPDIHVRALERTRATFHARHDAESRVYVYQISRRRTAFGKRFVWWVKDPLNVQRMRDAARVFPGMADLRAFTADDPEEKSTRVLIEELRIQESGALILIRIDGSHFLWKSVRRIVGYLAEAGRGHVSPEAFQTLSAIDPQEVARHTAPPSGLFLAGVYYHGETKPAVFHPLMGITDDR